MLNLRIIRAAVVVGDELVLRLLAGYKAGLLLELMIEDVRNSREPGYMIE